MVVAKPDYGLSAMTSLSSASLAQVLAGYEKQGASMLIAFGHEMNGNWYAWGQQPSAYIKAFQTLSDAVAKVWVQPQP